MFTVTYSYLFSYPKAVNGLFCVQVLVTFNIIIMQGSQNTKIVLNEKRSSG